MHTPLRNETRPWVVTSAPQPQLAVCGPTSHDPGQATQEKDRLQEFSTELRKRAAELQNLAC